MYLLDNNGPVVFIVVVILLRESAGLVSTFGSAFGSSQFNSSIWHILSQIHVVFSYSETVQT